jgi:hypothetical protein
MSANPAKTMFGFSFDDKPDFVNAAGVKWWVDPSLTDYCKNKGLFMRVFAVEDTHGKRTRVLVDQSGIIEEDTSFEGMACRVDKHVAAAQFDKM